MKTGRMVVICLLVTSAMICQSLASEGGLTAADDSLVTESVKSSKSVIEGMTATVFPGFFVHGIGNFYAGSPVSGSIMLALEAAGIFLVAINIKSEPVVVTGIPPGPIERDNRDTYIYTGMVLFLASWIADVVSTPFLVKKYNSELEQKTPSMSLRIAPSRDERFPVTLQVAFTF